TSAARRTPVRRAASAPFRDPMRQMHTSSLTKRGRALGAVGASLAGLALLVAPTAGAKAHQSEALVAGPTPALAYTAEVKVPTIARSKPNAGRIVSHVQTSAPWSGGRNQLLVLGSKHDTAGRTWLHVELPSRPNGSTGWLLADFTEVRPTDYRVVVSISKRTLTLFKRGKMMRSVSSVVGAPG